MDHEAALKHRRTCRRCGHVNAPGVIEPYASGPHYAKLLCAQCGAFWDNVGKPDSDPTKHRRPKAHLELVAEYSRGYCEMCNRKESSLRKPNHLVAHHVHEFKDGGTNDRANIWIVCDRCHSLIHWVRKTVGTEGVADDPS